MAAASVDDRQLLDFVQFQEQLHTSISPAQALRMYRAQTGQAPLTREELAPSIQSTRNPETSRAIPRNLSSQHNATPIIPQTQNIPIQQRQPMAIPSYQLEQQPILEHPYQLSRSFDSYHDFRIPSQSDMEETYQYIPSASFGSQSIFPIDLSFTETSFGTSPMSETFETSPASQGYDVYASVHESSRGQVPSANLIDPLAAETEMTRQLSGASVLAGGFDMLRMSSRDSSNSFSPSPTGHAPALLPGQVPAGSNPVPLTTSTTSTKPLPATDEKPNPSPKRKDPPTTDSPSPPSKTLRKTHQQPLAPATSSNNTSTTTRPRSSTTPYVRPKHPRKKCPHCPSDSEGFRGEHELRRHYERMHAEKTKRYVVRDLSADGKFLSKCRACSSGRTYGVDYNATAHLKRQHFNEEKNPGIKVPDNLRDWVEVKMVTRSELEGEACKGAKVGSAGAEMKKEDRARDDVTGTREIWEGAKGQSERVRSGQVAYEGTMAVPEGMGGTEALARSQEMVMRHPECWDPEAAAMNVGFDDEFVSWTEMPFVMS